MEAITKMELYLLGGVIASSTIIIGNIVSFSFRVFRKENRHKFKKPYVNMPSILSFTLSVLLAFVLSWITVAAIFFNYIFREVEEHKGIGK